MHKFKEVSSPSDCLIKQIFKNFIYKFIENEAELSSGRNHFFIGNSKLKPLWNLSKLNNSSQLKIIVGFKLKILPKLNKFKLLVIVHRWRHGIV
jgi:hypothetical protein